MLKRFNTDSKSITVALVVAASLVLAGCSDDDDDDGAVAGAGAGAAVADGTFTFTFTNTSETQPMTPPVVVAHTSVENGGLSLFPLGTAATNEVVEIAENGNNTPMVDLLTAAPASSVSDFAVAFTDPEAPGPLLPGASATVTLTPSDASQVMSVISMIVCTNDGFSAIDSEPFPTTIASLTAPIYDAGSELNTLDVNYWVPPCNAGVSDNLGDAEAGTIAAHPGQAAAAGTTAAGFDFAAGSRLLEINITPN